MKKFLALFVSLLFLCSILVAADTAEDGSISDAAPVTDDAIETEAEQYESASSGDAVLLALETQTSESEDDLEAELNLTEAEKNDISEVKSTIGLKLYILNRQLKHRIFVAIVHGNAIINYLDNKNITTTELKGIVGELNTTYVSIDPKTMTREQHNSTAVKAKELVTKFRDTAKSLVPEGELSTVMKRIADFEVKEKRKLEELSRVEWKARMLFNKQKFNEALKKVHEDAKQLRKDGHKLLEAEKRLRNLLAMKNRTFDRNLTKEDIQKLKENWKEGLKNYTDDKNRSVIKNERAQLAISIADTRKAIKEAQAAGEDIKDLEAQLAELNKQLTQFVPGKIVSADAKAKAAVVRAKIANMGKDKKISEKVMDIRQKRNETREALKVRLNERHEEVKDRIGERKEGMKNAIQERREARQRASVSVEAGDEE
jgi:hypothetical protein